MIFHFRRENFASCLASIDKISKLISKAPSVRRNESLNLCRFSSSPHLWTGKIIEWLDHLTFVAVAKKSFSFPLQTARLRPRRSAETFPPNNHNSGPVSCLHFRPRRVRGEGAAPVSHSTLALNADSRLVFGIVWRFFRSPKVSPDCSQITRVSLKQISGRAVAPSQNGKIESAKKRTRRSRCMCFVLVHSG